jgi:thiol-disulfide isomerase/thioredoxin
MSISGITGNLTTKHFKIKGGEIYFNNISGNPGLLLIHASWCGHCKKFIPTYQTMCKKLNKNGDDFPCVAIEDEELKKDGGQLSTALGVEGYPTLKFFDQHGKILGDYKGPRDESNLLDTICKIYHHCITRH